MDWTPEMKSAAMADAQKVCDQAKRIAELEAALAWYADDENYLRHGLASELDPMVMVDEGALARKVLPQWLDVEAATSPRFE